MKNIIQTLGFIFLFGILFFFDGLAQRNSNIGRYTIETE